MWDPELVTRTVNVLAGMARWHEESHDRRGDRVPPQAGQPSDGQLAAHGFMSVPPEVVAALSGSDAANLKWLGMMGGTKDYMHFELRDQPPRF